MYLPGLYDEVLYLTGAETDAEFTPSQTGTFKISCTMGMVPPIIVTVES
jgi:heme/copper-type cytochrome/quinol oxidase subunit 2